MSHRGAAILLLVMTLSACSAAPHHAPAARTQPTATATTRQSPDPKTSAALVRIAQVFNTTTTTTTTGPSGIAGIPAASPSSPGPNTSAGTPNAPPPRKDRHTSKAPPPASTEPGSSATRSAASNSPTTGTTSTGDGSSTCCSATPAPPDSTASRSQSTPHKPAARTIKDHASRPRHPSCPPDLLAAVSLVSKATEPPRCTQASAIGPPSRSDSQVAMQPARPPTTPAPQQLDNLRASDADRLDLHFSHPNVK